MAIPETMRVVDITEPGPSEALRIATRPVPAPGPGEVLIRVAAAGVNRADTMQRRGNYPPPPGASDILGLEVSGTVASAAPWIADPLVRNLGTMCGSVAHCDPEGDWNSVLLATGAEVIAQGPSGQRAIAIEDFVQDFFTNSLADDEMVTALHIPVPSGPSGGSYQKLERKVGDYATVGVAAHLELADDGTISAAGVAMTSVAPINCKAGDAEALLVGNAPSAELFAEAGSAAAAAAEPRDDVRGSARWKRQVVAAFTRRALAAAAEQAQS